MGPAISKALLQALNSGMFRTSLNHTWVTLIPKKKQTSRVIDYHPISLCNVLYKIIFKVIANRLRVVLPILISNSQCVFMPGRQITDNILVAYETIHTLSKKGEAEFYVT